MTVKTKTMTKPKMIDLRKELLNVPLLLSKGEADAFGAFAPDSFIIEDKSSQHDEMMFDVMFESGEVTRKPYAMVDGAAIIPVTGVLLHRMRWGASFATGYDYVRNLFDMALADNDVKGIVFDVHSPGGMVDGAFDLAEHIYANRGEKPSTAIVDAHAYSAAYLLASAAGSISAPKTGGVGSVGVVVMHTDYSKMLSDVGVKITFIHAGERKVDGNPYEALSPDVRNRIQASVDSSYDMFVDAVSRFRSMSGEAIRATEAGTFDAAEALTLGMVDAVESPDVALSVFVAELNGEKREMIMSNGGKVTVKAGQQAEHSATQENTFTQADIDAAAKAAASAERQRMSDVVNGELFAGREAAAKKMLEDTDLSAEAINSILKTQPVPEKSSSASVSSGKDGDTLFQRAMETTGNPNVGADGGDEDEDGDEDVSSRMLKNYRAATGVKAN